MQIIKKTFNNLYSSRQGTPVQGIVMHIAQGGIGAIHNWAKSANNKGASWHFAVSKSGDIYSYCAEEHAAWHAGLKWVNKVPYNPSGKALDINRLAYIVKKNKNINPNRYTIGIEHEGYTTEAWTEAMYKADVQLIIYLCKKYKIPIDRGYIIGHSEVDYLDRKNCPGSGLNWNKLFNILEDETMWKEKYKKVNSKLKSCQDSKKKLTKKYNTLASKFEKLSKSNQELKEKYDELNKNTSCKSKLDNAQLKIKTLERDIVVLKNKIKKLEGKKSTKDSFSTSLKNWLNFIREWLFKK